MKIVYVLKSFAMKAGVERVVSDKINFLAQNGYEVTMITYEQGKHPDAYPLYPSVRHLDLNVRFFEIMKYGLVRRLPLMIRLRTQFKSRLQSLIDEIQPDIIIVTTCSIKLMDIVLSIKTDARRVVESHAPCYAVKKSEYYNNKIILHFLASLYDKWMLSKVNKADILVVLTKGDADEWKQYASNIVVIPNPVTSYPLKVMSHDGSGRRIICAGRLNEEKRFDLIIEAFSYISNDCPDWRLDIYGDGSEKTALTNQIQRYDLMDRVTINPPTSDIYNEFQRSEFYVLSSRYEGFGLVLVEAMSCGIPCVAFKCKYGPEDIIYNNIDGLLVEDGNVNELANKMLWMITHTEERLQMGLNAHKNVLRFEKSVIMRRWIELFENMH